MNEIITDQTSELAKALANAQKKIEQASKHGTNPHFGKRYASLANVWGACQPALAENGLAVAQTIQRDGSAYWLRTVLLHESGQKIISDCPLLVDKADMQKLGSAITYARRYSLAAIVGVVQEDDDGAATLAAAPASASTSSAKNVRPISLTSSGAKKQTQPSLPTQAPLPTEMIDLGSNSPVFGKTFEEAYSTPGKSGQSLLEESIVWWSPKEIEPGSKPDRFMKKARAYVDLKKSTGEEEPPVFDPGAEDIPF